MQSSARAARCARTSSRFSGGPTRFEATCNTQRHLKSRSAVSHLPWWGPHVPRQSSGAKRSARALPVATGTRYAHGATQDGRRNACTKRRGSRQLKKVFGISQGAPRSSWTHACVAELRVRADRSSSRTTSQRRLQDPHACAAILQLGVHSSAPAWSLRSAQTQRAGEARELLDVEYDAIAPFPPPKPPSCSARAAAARRASASPPRGSTSSSTSLFSTGHTTRPSRPGSTSPRRPGAC